MQVRTLAPLMPLFLLVAVLPTFAQAPAPAAPPKPDAAPAFTAKPNTDKDEADEKAYPSQASIAAKITFGTVSFASPAIGQAFDAKNLAGAQKMIGQAGAFQGTVSKVYVSHGNGSVILDFAPRYREALTAVVKPAAYAKFPDLSLLLGKRVFVQGKFIAFHGNPEVELTTPAQVKVIVGK